MSTQSPDCRHISERAIPLRKGPLSYIDVFIKAIPDLWSPENPDGWIAAVVAENKLRGNKLFLEQMVSMQQSSIPDQTVMNYGNMKGFPQLQKAFCDLMNRTFVPGVPLTPGNMCILSGCTAVVDSLVFCLCNPGEGVLVPQPSYAAFDNDLMARAHLKPIEFPLDESKGEIEQQLESFVSQSESCGVPVRALLITNPNNPLGTIYKDSTVKAMLKWCIDHKIHYISDEIYALSVHEPGINFTSTLCTLHEMIGEGLVDNNDAKNYFHLLYGLSKDWCASGLRIGCLYSDNIALQEALNSLAPMAGVSNYQQLLISYLLSDVKWTEQFLSENTRELRTSYETLTRGLDKMSIDYQPAQAGIFVWVDMRKFLKENSWQGEKDLWEAMCRTCKVILTPGESCHAEQPGFFRICFAWVPCEALEIALNRIETRLLPLFDET